MTRDDDVAFMSSAMATLHAWLAEPWAEDALTLTLILTLILTLTLNLTLDGRDERSKAEQEL
eukprot:scaffold73735_cov90-Phaeocystis_antarctica.AAC.1